LVVVIAIVALLVAMLLPALTAARDLARQVQCLAQLHGHAIAAVGQYAADYRGYLPPMQGQSPTGQTLRLTNFVNSPMSPATWPSAQFPADYQGGAAGAPYVFRSQYFATNGGGYYDVLLFEVLYPDRSRDATPVNSPFHLIPTAHCPSDAGWAPYPNNHGSGGQRQASYSLNGYISYATQTSTASAGTNICQAKVERVQSPFKKVALVETHYQFATWNSGWIANATSGYSVPGFSAMAPMVPADIIVDNPPFSNVFSNSRHRGGFNSSYLDGSAKFIGLIQPSAAQVGNAFNYNSAPSVFNSPANLVFNQTGWLRPDYAATNGGNGPAAIANEREMFNIYAP
jgi:prepilin-type processing-associated H-X9-DG protein